MSSDCPLNGRVGQEHGTCFRHLRDRDHHRRHPRLARVGLAPDEAVRLGRSHRLLTRAEFGHGNDSGPGIGQFPAAGRPGRPGCCPSCSGSTSGRSKMMVTGWWSLTGLAGVGSQRSSTLCYGSGFARSSGIATDGSGAGPDPEGGLVRPFVWSGHERVEQPRVSVSSD